MNYYHKGLLPSELTADRTENAGENATFSKNRKWEFRQLVMCLEMYKIGEQFWRVSQ